MRELLQLCCFLNSKTITSKKMTNLRDCNWTNGFYPNIRTFFRRNLDCIGFKSPKTQSSTNFLTTSFTIALAITLSKGLCWRKLYDGSCGVEQEWSSFGRRSSYGNWWCLDSSRQFLNCRWLSGEHRLKWWAHY